MIGLLVGLTGESVGRSHNGRWKLESLLTAAHVQSGSAIKNSNVLEPRQLCELNLSISRYRPVTVSRVKMMLSKLLLP
jgi:hypothetical protein